MKILISGALSLLLVALASPASANHDQGQGKSQDHLHGPGSVPVIQVAAPSSGMLMTVGAVLLIGVEALGIVLGRRKLMNAKRD